MKIRIEIDDSILKKAAHLTGISDNLELINVALQKLIQQVHAQAMLDLKGKVKWDGDLNEMRG